MELYGVIRRQAELFDFAQETNGVIRRDQESVRIFFIGAMAKETARPVATAAMATASQTREP
jgi:hypothetical protein